MDSYLSDLLDQNLIKVCRSSTKFLHKLFLTRNQPNLDLVFMVHHDQILVNGQQDLPDIQLIRDLLNYLSGLQDAFNDQVGQLRQLILSVVQGLQVKEGTYQVGVVAIL